MKDPARLSHIWAKSPRPGEAAGESLTDHTLAVLRTVARLRLVNAQLADAVRQADIWNWIYWACALHDFGKCAAGFQRQLRSDCRWDRRHEVLSLAFLPLVCQPKDGLTFACIAAGIVAHHKDADYISDLYPTGRPVTDERIREMIGQVSEVDVELLASWLLGLRKSTAPAGQPAASDPVAFARRFQVEAPRLIGQALDEYEALVDNLHRGRSQPLLLACMALRGLVVSSDHIGSAHQWRAISVPLPPDTAERVRPASPFSHQQMAEQMVGSAMFIAPTGSGKTETALLWAAHQHSVRPVSHLFYVLPYQASMNAMQRRLKPALGEVALIHGRSLEAAYRDLLEHDYSPAQARTKAFAARNLAGLQVHGARVLSPYQLLKAAFRVKGYEAIATDLLDSALVYDEIHAYEPQRLGLIIAQMGDVAARFRARVCVMSATLPSFLQAWLAVEVPGLGPPITPTPAECERFRRHRLRLLHGDMLAEPGLEIIAQRATQGSMLVCCNTVRRAQQACDGLRERGINAELLHSRFMGRDRSEKERALIPGQRQESVLVATQVVEVSLNVSFDTLFTDPAPLEALFQRFGRVNRFERNGRLADVCVFSEPLDTRVYEPRLVAAAIDVLQEHCDQPVNEGELTAWLDAQYTAHVLEPIEESYRVALSLMKNKLRRLAPFQSDPALRDEFFEMFDSVEVLPLSYADEYRDLVANGAAIEADGLLVPINWRQWMALHRLGLTRDLGSDMPRVVDVPYDSDRGLRLP